MKALLIITGIVEAATGFALLVSPSLVSTLLLGVSLDAPAAMVVGRIAGAGLLGLGVACWLARNDGSSRAAHGLVAAMLVYNVAAVVILAYAGFSLGFSSLILWAAVIAHKVLAIWCIVCLWFAPALAGDRV